MKKVESYDSTSSVSPETKHLYRLSSPAEFQAQPLKLLRNFTRPAPHHHQPQCRGREILGSDKGPGDEACTCHLPQIDYTDRNISYVPQLISLLHILK